MVPQIKTILFATDLTENSRHAFQYASSVAARYEAAIVMLHVMEKLPSGAQQRLDMLVGAGSADAFRKLREQTAKDVLIGKSSDFHRVNTVLAEFYGAENTGDRHFSETCEVVIEEGRVPEEIVAAAEEHLCDLVVLGAHKGLLSGTAMGSVAKHVLRHSKIPVLVVPPAETT